MKREKRRPVQEFRIGRVTSSVWDNGGWFRYSTSRLYQPSQGGWERASDYGLVDAGAQKLVIDLATQWIYHAEQLLKSERPAELVALSEELDAAAAIREAELSDEE
jgi:hypothetical protein